MIWNDDFIWLHFPKCAGSKTESLFRRYFSDRKDIHQDIINIAIDPHVSWHDSLAARERRDKSFVTGNRLVICPIRRLPAWLESRYNYEVTRSSHLDHRAERLLTGRYLNADGSEGHADDMVRLFLPETLLSSPQLLFVRTEYFEEDFRRAFDPFIDIGRIPPREFAKRENTSTKRLPTKIHQRLWYNNDDLYQHCPLWSEVEQLAYGNHVSAEPISPTLTMRFYELLKIARGLFY